MRLEVRVRSAIASTRAPLSPWVANSSVATSRISCLVRSGSFLRAVFRSAAPDLVLPAISWPAPPHRRRQWANGLLLRNFAAANKRFSVRLLPGRAEDLTIRTSSYISEEEEFGTGEAAAGGHHRESPMRFA